MNASQTIVTRYANRVLFWHPDTLQTLLAELRSERLAHHISVASESAEAEHNALMAKAEAIKQHATNAISEAQSQHA
jgi:hypothetical protein